MLSAESNFYLKYLFWTPWTLPSPDHSSPHPPATPPLGRAPPNYTVLSQVLTFWHRSFTFNSNKSPSWCNSFSVYYPDVCLQLNMFRAFPCPSLGAQWLQWQPLVFLRIVVMVVLCSWSGQPARPRTQHDYRHDTNVKPEAATAIIELLMMGVRMSETCWAVNNRQDNKLKKCCIRLVIYLN